MITRHQIIESIKYNTDIIDNTDNVEQYKLLSNQLI
jgi:hypothetical protein